VTVPYWLAQGLFRRHTVEVDVPVMYGHACREDLRADAIACRLGDKSSFFFEVGMKVASLLRDHELLECLMTGLKTRWVEIVNMLGKLGVARHHVTALNPVSATFPQTLTALEQEMYSGGREAETHFKRWAENFKSYQIKPSTVAEVPAFAPKRLVQALAETSRFGLRSASPGSELPQGLHLAGAKLLGRLALFRWRQLRRTWGSLAAARPAALRRGGWRDVGAEKGAVLGAAGMILPAARIVTPTGTQGSGFVVAHSEGATYVLTNHHVIRDCIQQNDRWDPVDKSSKKVEQLLPVSVETFRYDERGRHLQTVTTSAEIAAYTVYGDKWSFEGDLALLKLKIPLEGVPAVHVMAETTFVEEVRMLDEVIMV
ncbi:unnamed protein product, partial [Polarella glacialis]